MPTSQFPARSFRRALVGAVAAGLTLAAQPASAAIMLMTRTVKITDVKNPAQSNLRDTDLKIEITYDTSRKPPVRYDDSVGAYIILDNKNDVDPFLSVTYSYGTEQHTFRQSRDNVEFQNINYKSGASEHGLTIRPPRDWDGLGDAAYLNLGGDLVRADPDLPFDIATPFFRRLADDGEFQLRIGGVEVADFTFDSDDAFTGSISVRELTAGVPEPSAWALMILGFGSIGAVLRRRSAFA